jgi:hypothetical protein
MHASRRSICISGWALSVCENEPVPPLVGVGVILAREPDAGKLPVRFDEREVETEHGAASEAPADERAGNRYASPKPPRHLSTLQFIEVTSPRAEEFRAVRGVRKNSGPCVARRKPRAMRGLREKIGEGLGCGRSRGQEGLGIRALTPAPRGRRARAEKLPILPTKQFAENAQVTCGEWSRYKGTVIKELWPAVSSEPGETPKEWCFTHRAGF